MPELDGEIRKTAFESTPQLLKRRLLDLRNPSRTAPTPGSDFRYAESLTRLAQHTENRQSKIDRLRTLQPMDSTRFLRRAKSRDPYRHAIRG
jgi:superfamily II RNA helicase